MRIWPAVALTVFVAACVVFCVVGILGGWLRASTLQEWVAGSGFVGWAGYLLGNVLLCVLWMPRMWRLMAGSLLGVVPGAVRYPLAGDAMLEPTSPVFLGSVGAIALFLLLTLWFARRSLGPVGPGDGGAGRGGDEGMPD